MAVSPGAERSFREVVVRLGLNPDNQWVGGYVEYERTHFRRFLPSDLTGTTVLEFGCNMGASAVIMAELGASVVAIDVNSRYLEVARANALRYGVNVEFLRVEDSSKLPFANASFDWVNCNSVLEYLSRTVRTAVLNEIDRLLKPEGHILVTGTSNRLWPREVHSRRWLVNYLPFGGYQRGVWPWELRRPKWRLEWLRSPLRPNLCLRVVKRAATRSNPSELNTKAPRS